MHISMCLIDGSVLTIPDIKEEYEISSLELRWGYKYEIEEDYLMMESIDLISLDYKISNGVLQFDLDEIAEQIVTEINNAGMMLRFSIAGECNNDLNGLATLQIPVIIESEVHTSHFELF